MYGTHSLRGELILGRNTGTQNIEHNFFKIAPNLERNIGAQLIHSIKLFAENEGFHFIQEHRNTGPFTSFLVQGSYFDGTQEHS